MPEMPEIRALAERLDQVMAGGTLAKLDQLQFSSLKTFAPRPDEALGHTIESVGSLGKYVMIRLDGGMRLLVHLSQGGRVDVEGRIEARVRTYQRAYRKAQAASPPRLEVLISNEASDSTTMIDVRARMMARSRSRISSSVYVSTADSVSSRIRMRGSMAMARASAVRCF